MLNNKEQIDIEIQVTASEYWAERTLFYLGKMFTDQLKPGEDYQKLEKMYSYRDFEFYHV